METTPHLDRIRAIPDPETRAREAAVYLQRANGIADSARLLRDDAIREMRRAGITRAVAAAAAGVSVAHVKMLAQRAKSAR